MPPDGAWFLAQRMGLESLGKRRKEFAKGEGSQSRASGCERVIGCRRQVRDLVFLVLVLQICRADGAEKSSHTIRRPVKSSAWQTMILLDRTWLEI